MKTCNCVWKAHCPANLTYEDKLPFYNKVYNSSQLMQVYRYNYVSVVNMVC